MIVNHKDNNALFCQTIDRANCEPLIAKLHECFHLFQKVDDHEVKDALYMAVCDAVDLAENNAFDKAAELQAAITTDELTHHEEGNEAPEVSVLTDDQGNCALRVNPAYLVYDTASNPTTDDISAQLPDYFGGCTPIDVEGFGIDPSGGIVLQFHDKHKAKAPTMKLQIMPRLNADGFPVLAVCTYVPSKK